MVTCIAAVVYFYDVYSQSKSLFLESLYKIGMIDIKPIILIQIAFQLNQWIQLSE